MEAVWTGISEILVKNEWESRQKPWEETSRIFEVTVKYFVWGSREQRVKLVWVFFTVLSTENRKI